MAAKRRDLPRLNDEVVEHDATTQHRVSEPPPSPRGPACLIVVRGSPLGSTHFLVREESSVGRGHDCDIALEDTGVSRVHARIFRAGLVFEIEDMQSVNGTHVNGRRLIGRHRLTDGDRIGLGPECILEFTLVTGPRRTEESTDKRTQGWTVDTWRAKPNAQPVEYDTQEVTRVLDRLKRLPPLVTSWEVERLKSLIADAQNGSRFFLQGGDCAETFDDCNAAIITNKLKILLQMSLVLIHGVRRPVIRVGRLAGQYAKPRSRPTETQNGVTLRSYLGDLVNRPEFTPDSRRPDPNLLLAGYQHAALTLNFIRALSNGGFSDLRHPEYFDLSFFERAELPSRLRVQYERTARRIAEGLQFVKALGDEMIDDLMKVEFFTSHEGLNLEYEAAHTRTVPRRESFYDLTGHMPWIGDRTRALEGAHVDFFRGIANPVGVKLGPNSTPEDVVELCRALNPYDEPGKLVFITRMGANDVERLLPPLIEAIQRRRRRVLWVSDAMHGNMVLTKSGVKTRDFDAILKEIEISFDMHRVCGSVLGGVHFELTGEDVTECIGGGLTEADLDTRYLTACDPRLNYRQAIEMAFSIGRHMQKTPSKPSFPPPPEP